MAVGRGCNKYPKMSPLDPQVRSVFPLSLKLGEAVRLARLGGGALRASSHVRTLHIGRNWIDRYRNWQRANG